MTIYSEKLNPPLGLTISTLLLIPGFGLMLGPFNWYLAFSVGIAITIAVNVLLYNFSPSIVISGDQLILGRASIPLSVLANPSQKTGEEAFKARGPELGPDVFFRSEVGLMQLLKLKILIRQTPTTEF